jgi:ABC-type sugar transport system ATPase subunit
MLAFDSITKTFAGVTALSDVSFEIARGHCHALMGENGAGKSTLGKILAGIHRPDSGRILLDGVPISFRSPADAIRAGVGMVHQELAFCPELSVAENLCMGQYPSRFGLVNRRAMHRRAESLLGQIGVTLDVARPMRKLSTAQEQLVQIASAVGLDARVLILDEPTSSLSESESRELFRLIHDLRAKGVTMIYISHRLPEVFRLCDAITVLRDGRFVGTLREQANADEVVRMMIGRTLSGHVARKTVEAPGRLMMEVRELSSPGRFSDVSFDVRAGEIVGLAGLVGAGRSEVAKAIFGIDRAARGTVRIDGHALRLGSVRDAMARGAGFVPEDRKRQGLVLPMSGRANVSMAMLRRLSRLGWLRVRAERRDAVRLFQRLNVRAPSVESPVASLSGGNQQKVALAKWLARGAKVLIVDEPTRGVDVGAKAAIHELLDELARQGVAILLISSELPEVLSLATRILVMRQGRLVGEVARDDATQEKLLRLMAGVQAAAA